MKSATFYILTLCLVLNGISASIVNRTALCCPEGWFLAKLQVGVLREIKYDCLSPTQVQELVDQVEVLGETLPINGLNIQQSSPPNFINIPRCKNPVVKFLAVGTDVEIVPVDTCLAHIDRRFATISCPSQEGDDLETLSFLHKCCPADHFYDSAERKCVPKASAKEYEMYGEFFFRAGAGAGVVFVDDTVECPKNRALVEYRLGSEEFSIHAGQLTLLKQRRRNKFAFKDFCIEAIVKNSQNDTGHSRLLGEQLQNVDGIKAIKRTQLQEYFIRTCTDVSVCREIACIRRCCADGEMFAKGSATSYCKKDGSDISFHSFESLEISGNFSKPAVYGILRSLDCRKYRLDPDSFSDEAHFISEHDGSLHVMSTRKNYTNAQYCVEKVRTSSNGDQKLYTFLCFDSDVVSSDKIRFKMYPIGLLISCLFYALTLAVYLSISKLRNLPGKILICLVSSLFAAYLSIALGQLVPTPNDDICFASGFFVYFCLIAAFAWMNVMCFDIWQTFSSTKKKQGNKKYQAKRFVIYSTYGWGLPITLTVLTVSLTKSGVLNDSIRPHFGHGRCWFTYDTLASANLLFFSGPVGILFLINLFLFFLTFRYCNRIKREIFRMQSSNLEKPVLKRRFFVDKARFAMNTKLIIVMGVTWLLELLSILFYDHKKTFFWAISDSFNVLLGVFVFFIFVFKKRVWHSVLQRVGLRPNESIRTLQNVTLATHSTYGGSTSLTRLNAIDGNLSPMPGVATKRSPLL